MKQFAIFLFFIFVVNAFAELDVQKINQAIADQGVTWRAADNWVTRLSPQERQKMVGTIRNVNVESQDILALTQIENLPVSFDWRDNNGNFVTPVRNQGSCGSCWAFSAIAQVESWWQVYHAVSDTNIDLSEQSLLSCSDAGTCGGGWPDAALTFIQETGVPDEDCLPYAASDFITCEEACPNWQDSVQTIPGWQYITGEEPIVENIKQAVFRHPVSASYTVYDDFYAYAGGIYEHVWGEVSGGHAVLIVGWEDENECWIVKNSWGPSWGEDGYFRIRWGDSGIGEAIPFIYDNTTFDAIVLSDTSFSFAVQVDQNVQDELLIMNQSEQPLQVSCIDIETPLAWHPDEFLSHDGSSWWCGSPAIGGYGNHWLQYLDTPEVTVPENAFLSFNLFYAIESPGGAEEPYDGWDAANVWISTDGGATFTVITPEYPAYDMASSWAFGEPDQGWGFGPNIAGWGGTNSTWEQARFDLAAFADQSVILRFAFASDMGHCTSDDAGLTGIHIDNILIASGENEFFADSAKDGEQMKVQGYGEQAARWLTVNNPILTVDPFQQAVVPFSIDAKSLYPGKYESQINIYSNDQSNPLVELPIYLTVKPKSTDLRVTGYYVNSTYFLNEPITPQFSVMNWGLNDIDQVQVSCAISQAEETLFTESKILFVPAGKVVDFLYNDIVVSDTGLVDISFELTYQAEENTITRNFSIQTRVTDVVDDFESSAAGLWDFSEGEWTITSNYGGFNSDFSLKTGGPQMPHTPGLSGIALCRHEFSVKNASMAGLSYAAFVHSEENVDVCYTEISTDSMNWIVIDEMSGLASSMQWDNRSIDLLNFLPKSAESFRLRFRYESDEDDEYLGVMLDNIRFYFRAGEFPTKVTDAEIPTEFELLQNYPNPFNPQTTVSFLLPQQAYVRIDILNINGQSVAALTEQNYSAGRHSLSWNAENYSAGIYFYRFSVQTDQGNSFVQTKKMLLVK